MVGSQAQPDHQSDIQDFIAWVDKKRCLGRRGPRLSIDCPFLPYTELEAYLDDRGIGKLLIALFPDDHLDKKEIDHIRRRYSKVFSILLLIGKGLFIKRFIKFSSLSDSRLPFESWPANFPKATNDALFFNSFQAEQWMFCAQIFEHSIDSRFADDLILPIIEKSELGHGGSAFVYKVVLHEAYNILNPKKTSESVILSLLPVLSAFSSL